MTILSVAFWAVASAPELKTDDPTTVSTRFFSSHRSILCICWSWSVNRTRSWWTKLRQTEAGNLFECQDERNIHHSHCKRYTVNDIPMSEQPESCSSIPRALYNYIYKDKHVQIISNLEALGLRDDNSDWEMTMGHLSRAVSVYRFYLQHSVQTFHQLLDLNIACVVFLSHFNCSVVLKHIFEKHHLVCKDLKGIYKGPL